MEITDMKVGQKVTADLVLAGASIRQTKSVPPRNFLTLDLSDGKNTLDGKIWNYDSSQGVPEKGKVYTVTGVIGEYQGKKQITLDGFYLAVDQDLVKFLPQYAADVDRVYDAALELIRAIKNQELQIFCMNIYKTMEKEIKVSSSALGVHHVGVGGNLTHCYEVADMAVALGERARSMGYTVNLDLCIAGGLLHDIGKCQTYTYDGAAVAMTVPGQMLDHIVLGIEIVDKFATQWIAQGYTMTWLPWLKHIIASHHGELEYGSPVYPLCIEAYLVNIADQTSSTLAMVKAANDKAILEGQSMTDRIYQLHNRPHFLQNTVMDDMNGVR